MERISPSSYYGYSSDNENETRREESPSREQFSSSNNPPSTRIPDRNRRVRFAPEQPRPGPSLSRSSSGHFRSEKLDRNSGSEEDRRINLNKAAEKMVKNEAAYYPGIMKEYTDKGELPPAIAKKFDISSPQDIKECIATFNEMLKEQ
ncbi:MAG TPA: hypothetical protein VF616_22140 [Duganella sp.]|uniref:hypothetical protein n=1 Tax=Duganella sp. TaxID=1904440 RepID=UPI002ED63571